MAKPPIQVHVSSSDFKSLLDVQKISLENVSSMKQMMEKMQGLKPEGASESKKIELETLKVKTQLITAYKEELKTAKELQKIRDEEADAIANIAKGMKTFKTMGERFSEFGKKLKESLSPTGIKVGLMKQANVFGVFNKSIEREKFIKAQQKLGATNEDGSVKTRDQLKQDFKGAQKSAKALGKTDQEIAQFRKDTGISESDLGKTKEGKRLLAQKSAQAEEFAKFDKRAEMVRREDKPEMTSLKASDIVKTPTAAFADAGANEEAQLEQNKMVGDQTSLLTKIEENTRGGSPDQKAKPAEGGGGQGLMAGLLGGGKAGKAIEGMKNFGIGLIAIAGALWVASKAFENFGSIDWGSIGKGLVALGGLVVAAIALDKVKGSILKGAFVLGVLGVALWGVGEAFKTFAELDWETIGKGIASIVGLGVVAAVMGTFIGPVALGALALAGLGAALWVVGEAMQAVGQGFSDMTDGLERLAALDGGNLLKVAAGVGALGLAMAVFGAGQAAAGVTNLVTGFLSAVTGQKTPVEQLIEIGKAGEGVEKAGNGMQKLGQAMTAFSAIKGDSLKAIKQFPWEEATKFVAAGGQMSVDGARVYNQSKGNADESSKTQAQGGGNKTNVVNAPVTNTSNNTQVYASAIRNQESSQSRYLQNRFAKF